MDCNYILFGIAFTAFKLLFTQCYHSTDFEVHRNWLAITSNLPIESWYHEDTSQWTLDYPPLFAWFEYVLSIPAKYFDPQMLTIQADAYSSPGTIQYQRLTVALTDWLYIYASYIFVHDCLQLKGHRALTYAIMLATNFGLFLVDHMHFQYNGFLSGLLLMSIVRMWQERHLEAGIWFAILLNFKHIYLYIAPVYFVQLLAYYCFVQQPTKKSTETTWTFSPMRFILLGCSVAVVFAISFGPFIYMGQLMQVLSRLFPFKRGLCHAYWAPNVWALYNVVDKSLLVAGKKLKVFESNSTASMTGGLVQEFEHSVLPSVKPLATMIVTALSMLPVLYRVWRPSVPATPPIRRVLFVRALALCAFSSFMFGWHVHEKAILLVIIPQSLLLFCSSYDAHDFLLTSILGNFSLFPLVFTSKEQPVKISTFLLYTIFSYQQTIFTPSRTPGRSRKVSGGSWTLRCLNMAESFYLTLICPVLLYTLCLHELFLPSLPFLPLLLMSLYCSVGLFYCYITAMFRFFKQSLKVHVS